MTHRLVTRFGVSLLFVALLFGLSFTAPVSAATAPTCTDSTPPDGTANTVEISALQGACYEIAIPKSGWNHDLVVYNHGYTAPFLPVALPAVQSLRDALLSSHFAVAYSAFRANGYVVKEAIADSHSLTQYFKKKYGLPAHTFVAGHSMGGSITMALAEKYPKDYQGALPMCGVLGSWTEEFTYVTTFRVILDYYVQAVTHAPLDPLAGTKDAKGNIYDALNPSPQLVAALAGGQAQTALAAAFFNASGNAPNAQALQISRITGVPADIASFMTVLAANVFGVQDAIARSKGNSFENRDNYYISGATDATDKDLNQKVERFAANASAVKYVQQNYTTTGKAPMPVLSIHTTQDPFVPLYNEGVYRARANAAGHGANNVFQSVNRYGHCTFSAGETIYAFTELVLWVEAGQKPIDDADITGKGGSGAR